MKRIKDPEGSKQMNLIGGKIRDARIHAGLTQSELAIKLETIAVYICRGSISRIENGERIITDIEIDGISRVLNVPIDWLFKKEV